MKMRILENLSLFCEHITSQECGNLPGEVDDCISKILVSRPLLADS